MGLRQLMARRWREDSSSSSHSSSSSASSSSSSSPSSSYSSSSSSFVLSFVSFFLFFLLVLPVYFTYFLAFFPSFISLSVFSFFFLFYFLILSFFFVVRFLHFVFPSFILSFFLPIFFLSSLSFFHSFFLSCSSSSFSWLILDTLFAQNVKNKTRNDGLAVVFEIPMYFDKECTTEWQRFDSARWSATPSAMMVLQWTHLTSMPIARRGAVAVALRHFISEISGRTINGNTQVAAGLNHAVLLRKSQLDSTTQYYFVMKVL